MFAGLRLLRYQSKQPQEQPSTEAPHNSESVRTYPQTIKWGWKIYFPLISFLNLRIEMSDSPFFLHFLGLFVTAVICCRMPVCVMLNVLSHVVTVDASLSDVKLNQTHYYALRLPGKRRRHYSLCHTGACFILRRKN